MGHTLDLYVKSNIPKFQNHSFYLKAGIWFEVEAILRSFFADSAFLEFEILKILHFLFIFKDTLSCFDKIIRINLILKKLHFQPTFHLKGDLGFISLCKIGLTGVFGA